MRLLCKALRGRGLGVLVVAESVDADAYLGCADRIASCDDLLSEDAVIAALEPYREELAEVVAVGERSWPAILGAALRLRVPVRGLRGHLEARIKPRTRAALAAHLPLAHRLVDRDDAARATAAASVGLPLVVKPIWGHGGDYVSVVERARDVRGVLADTFAALDLDERLRPFFDGDRAWNPRRQLLVEAYAPGRELSVEGFVQDGVVVVLMIQEKTRFEHDAGMRYETANVSPAPLDPDEARHIAEHVQVAIAALGIDASFVHVELKWDPPVARIIEVNPRLGGGSIGAMIEHWTGLDVRDTTVRLLLGEPVEYRPRPQEGFLLGVFVNADEPGRLREIEGLTWARAQPEFCFDTRYRRSGELIPPRGSLADREAWMYAYDVFFRCRDGARADELYDQAKARVRVRCDPV